MDRTDNTYDPRWVRLRERLKRGERLTGAELRYCTEARERMMRARGREAIGRKRSQSAASRGEVESHD